MIVFCARPNGLQFILCLMSLIEALKLCVSCVSATSSDVLIIRHGRSRVRHSSEKSHIRWGLQAFDNLTLYDYDYEGANATNSNETLFDFGALQSFGANQSFLGAETFGYGDASFGNGTNTATNGISTANDPKWGSTMAPPLLNRWSSISPSTVTAKNPKLAKKQIMAGIRKNVEEGIEYLRTHAHLTQQSAVMPSEKALLQLQKQAEKLNLLTIRNRNEPYDPYTSAAAQTSTIKQTKSAIVSASVLHNPIRREHESDRDNEHSLGYYQFNDKERDGNEKPPLKDHPISESFGGENSHATNEQRIDDEEIQNDEVPSSPHLVHNESAHQSNKHPHKSNKSHTRLTHDGAKPAGQSNGIATLKTEIDSIVTSIRNDISAAVLKKNHDESLNGNSANAHPHENSNATKPNLRSQSNRGKVVPASTQLPSEKQKSLLGTDQQQKPPYNDGIASNVKSNKIVNNNQFEANSFVSPLDELNEQHDEQQASGDSGGDEMISFPYDAVDDQTTTYDGKSITGGDGSQLPIYRWEDMDLDDLDEISRNNRINLKKGRDVVTKFLQIVESQHLLGANCSAGTALNLGEGVVDRYAQDRFRVEAEVAVNRANMLTR